MRNWVKKVVKAKGDLYIVEAFCSALEDLEGAIKAREDNAKMVLHIAETSVWLGCLFEVIGCKQGGNADQVGGKNLGTIKIRIEELGLMDRVEFEKGSFYLGPLYDLSGWLYRTADESYSVGKVQGTTFSIVNRLIS